MCMINMNYGKKAGEVYYEAIHNTLFDFLVTLINLIHNWKSNKAPSEKKGKNLKVPVLLFALSCIGLLLTVILEIWNITPSRPVIIPFDGSIGPQDEFIMITAEDGSDIYYSFDTHTDPKDDMQKYTGPIPRKEWPNLPFTIGVRTKVSTPLGDKWLDEIVMLRFYYPEESGGYSEDKPEDDAVPENIVVTHSFVSQDWAPNYDKLPDGFLSGWGDNGGGRESYTLDEVNAGALGNQIVFNSISDSVIGNEKNFVGARVDTGINLGKDNVWEGNLIQVNEGETYLVRLFCHNNSPFGYAATAENVEACFVIPEETGRTIAINGMLQSSNAMPSKYWDSVVLTSERPFHLEYITESARMENNAIGTNGGITLEDQIAAGNWTTLGYTTLDGQIPGCYQYDCYLSIKVKPVFEPTS